MNTGDDWHSWENCVTVSTQIGCIDVADMETHFSYEWQANTTDNEVIGNYNKQ